MKKSERENVRYVVSPTLTAVEDTKDGDDAIDDYHEDSDSQKSLEEFGEDRHTSGKKKHEKKTTSQRNKMRRLNARKLEDSKSKALKKQAHDINSIKTIVKVLTKEDQSRHRARKVKEDMKCASNIQSMTYDDAGAIFLSNELPGNLRSLKPSTCPVKSHLALMAEKGTVTRKNDRKRRAYEKPHQGKNIKWVARYKYAVD